MGREPLYEYSLDDSQIQKDIYYTLATTTDFAESNSATALDENTVSSKPMALHPQTSSVAESHEWHLWSILFEPVCSRSTFFLDLSDLLPPAFWWHLSTDHGCVYAHLSVAYGCVHRTCIFFLHLPLLFVIQVKLQCRTILIPQHEYLGMSQNPSTTAPTGIERSAEVNVLDVIGRMQSHKRVGITPSSMDKLTQVI